MKILVSACLMGENCKYNGKNNFHPEILEFVKDHEVVLVCPEVMGGLPTPRVPSEIVDGVVMNREGVCVDREFRLGAEIAFQIAKEKQVDLAILQSRSPSCGGIEVYDGSFSKRLVPGQGIFAGMIKEAGILILDSSEFVEQVQRVKLMEETLDHAMEMAGKEENLSFAERQQMLREVDLLKNYVESGLWMKDFEADEAGFLPKSLKRGVLSEDGIAKVME